MPRIPRVRGLQSLQLASAPQCAANRAPFTARALSTSAALNGKNTDWLRGKLWKGKAPGPEDPYTQRMEVEETSNLPDEAYERQPREPRIPRALQESRIALPPKRTEAVSEKELQAVDPTYVPATVIEGLEEIETLKTWWEQPGHWGEESAFKGFGSVDKVHNRQVLEVYLRRAVVEALALREGGLLDEWAAKKWPVGELEDVLAVQLKVVDGKPTLSGDVEALTGQLIGEVEDVEGKILVEEAKEIVKAWDAEWKDIVLDDHLKFAVSTPTHPPIHTTNIPQIRKRLYQLTGTLIPDAKLAASRTVKHILTLVSKPPKQEKLAAILQTQGKLSKLANVTVHDRRVTPIDKEVSVGRWKVIEEELTKRGLPVTGTAGLGKNMERQWLTGKA